MDNESQQVPPVPNQTRVKTASNFNFFKTLAYGFVIVSIGISIAVGGYLLGVSKSNFQPIISKVSTSTSLSADLASETASMQGSASAKAGDSTANWKTYISNRYGIEFKYPTDVRILQTSNYTLPALNTNKDIVMAVQSVKQDYPRSLTGLDVFVNNDVEGCFASSSGQKVTKTKNINGVNFIVYGENFPDDAMGGLRSLSDEYRIVRNNMCFRIQLSVFWKDISFMHGATDLKQATAQELEEQQDWIKTQQQLNNQILSTFKFSIVSANLALPTTCVDKPEGVPVITSLSNYSGSIGTKIEIRGCNFSGFEGDKNAWIENDQGIKGILYGEGGSTSKILKVTLKSPLCQNDNSYSGLSCNAWLTLNTGTYKIYTLPWGKKSNEVNFTIK